VTGVTSVDRIVDRLLAVGYRKAAVPLKVAGITFDFQAALLGADKSSDLVLISDSAIVDEKRILKSLEGIARAMDVVGSRRPITCVLTGPRPSSASIDAMSRVCRVLPVGIPAGQSDDPIGNWISVLLPLKLPDMTSTAKDPLQELKEGVEGLGPEIAALIDLAPHGATAVHAGLIETLSETLAILNLEGDP